MQKNQRRMAIAVVLCCAAAGRAFDYPSLSKLTPGRTGADNALWLETPPERRFHTSKEVVVADLKGPAMITMMHFAYPQKAIADPKNYRLGRDLLIRAWWDGEENPSIDCPMVDFFCDPAGLREQVNTALTNKRRGWNCYFPMPFRKSARVVLVYDGPEAPGDKLWAMMPCYSYVMWRELKDFSAAEDGYFHARWHQQAVLMGKEDYPAMEAKGRGKFIAWNVTVRRPGLPGYPVDMNEKFFIDGEKAASIEFQGIEDSFGYSWGFPESENIYQFLGYWPFMKGAAAYRFFLQDSISFEQSLRVAIGFGENEDKMFFNDFSRPGTHLQLSSTCYWYQTEPHVAFPAMPAAADREPAPEQPFWPLKAEPLPTEQQLRERGVKLQMLCGRPEKEVIFAEKGFAAAVKQGYDWAGWGPPVYHCRGDNKELQIELTVPKGTTGKLRVFIIDPDSYEGGRKQEVFVGDKSLGTFERFQDGKWVETAITPEMTAEGRLLIRAVNRQTKSNAAISIVEWVSK